MLWWDVLIALINSQLRISTRSQVEY